MGYIPRWSVDRRLASVQHGLNARYWAIGIHPWARVELAYRFIHAAAGGGDRVGDR